MKSILDDFFKRRKNNQRVAEVKYLNEADISENIHCVKIIVSGIVQGVGFRYTSKMLADQLNITGSVKNLESGEVEIIAYAEQDIIDQFIQDIAQGPSPAATVDQLSIKWLPFGQLPSSFEILY